MTKPTNNTHWSPPLIRPSIHQLIKYEPNDYHKNNPWIRFSSLWRLPNERQRNNDAPSKMSRRKIRDFPPPVHPSIHAMCTLSNRPSIHSLSLIHSFVDWRSFTVVCSEEEEEEIVFKSKLLSRRWWWVVSRRSFVPFQSKSKKKKTLKKTALVAAGMDQQVCVSEGLRACVRACVCVLCGSIVVCSAGVMCVCVWCVRESGVCVCVWCRTVQSILHLIRMTTSWCSSLHRHRLLVSVFHHLEHLYL